MVGLLFLYVYFNLYSMGGGYDVFLIDDVMMDIELCFGVFEFFVCKFYIDNEFVFKFMYFIV